MAEGPRLADKHGDGSGGVARLRTAWSAPSNRPGWLWTFLLLPRSLQTVCPAGFVALTFLVWLAIAPETHRVGVVQASLLKPLCFGSGGEEAAEAGKGPDAVAFVMREEFVTVCRELITLVQADLRRVEDASSRFASGGLRLHVVLSATPLGSQHL